MALRALFYHGASGPLMQRPHAVSSQGRLVAALEVKVPLPRIQPLLAFRDLLEGPPEGFGAWRAPEGQFPWYELSPEALAFVMTLDREGFLIAFDWDAWLQSSPDYVTQPELLAEADLETLRRLLTAHVRADRFTDGHLAEMHRIGHLAAILRRLQALYQSGIA